MKRLIYCSQATHDMGPDELVALLEVAREKNGPAGLTGMLLYCGQSFMQMLEGDSKALDATYARILVDERHVNLRMLLNKDVASRMFTDWSMGFEHIDEDELAHELDGFTAATSYPLVNPDLVSNAGVAETLLGLYAKNKVA